MFFVSDIFLVSAESVAGPAQVETLQGSSNTFVR
jgi:hypothetical protein